MKGFEEGRMVEADGYEAGYSAGLQEGLRRSIGGTLNEKKIKEVFDYCYSEAHGLLAAGDADVWDCEEVLENIRDKIEELTDDDLGEGDV